MRIILPAAAIAVVANAASAQLVQLNDSEFDDVSAGRSAIISLSDGGRINVNVDGRTLRVSGDLPSADSFALLIDGRTFDLPSGIFDITETLATPPQSVVVTQSGSTSINTVRVTASQSTNSRVGSNAQITSSQSVVTKSGAGSTSRVAIISNGRFVVHDPTSPKN
jgi:hypothetical protein